VDVYTNNVLLTADIIKYQMRYQYDHKWWVRKNLGGRNYGSSEDIIPATLHVDMGKPPKKETKENTDTQDRTSYLVNRIWKTLILAVLNTRQCVTTELTCFLIQRHILDFIRKFSLRVWDYSLTFSSDLLLMVSCFQTFQTQWNHAFYFETWN